MTSTSDGFALTAELRQALRDMDRAVEEINQIRMEWSDVAKKSL